MTEEEKKKKTIFWTRVVLLVFFGIIFPFAFIAWRFSLFTQVSKISLNGWGIVGIAILFLISRFYFKALKGKLPYSMALQIIQGIFTIIVPLIALVGVLYAIRNDIDYFIQALLITIVCECVAIPVNPLPKWAYEQKDKQLNNKFSELIRNIYKENKGE